MLPLGLRLKPTDLRSIRHALGIGEPRVISPANILNCRQLGYVSSDIARILNVDSKTVTNVGNAYLEGGLESALHDEERSGALAHCRDGVLGSAARILSVDLDLIVQEAEKRELIDSSISRETIRILLKEHDLKPWQEKMWCIGAGCGVHTADGGFAGRV